MHRTGLLFIALGAAALAALFLLFRPPPPAPLAAPEPPREQRIELVVHGAQRVSGPDTVRVTQGTPVVLRITVDHADELHLHGYDLSLKLAANVPGELRFTADRSGRFEYELHHAHADLGALEVAPR